MVEDCKNAMMTKAGFVALIGAPNTGKSTLMNAMVGQKVSIVTPKVQPHGRVRGISMHNDIQIIFVDTPGIKPNGGDRAMVHAAWRAKMVTCCCCFMIAHAALLMMTLLNFDQACRIWAPCLFSA